MNLPRHAFTLIELLIVVAIIAILAAIAVPNFLEAQTRSKISRVKADQRTLVTGFESYFVDANHYPVCPTLNNVASTVNQPNRVFMNLSSSPAATKIISGYWPTLLTTPLAYLTSICKDPFPTEYWGEPFNTPPPVRVSPPWGNRNYFFWIFPDGRPSTISNGDAVQYIISSPGPDQSMGLGMEWTDNELGTNCLYDPSNGTVSGGNISYIGPGNTPARLSQHP